MTHLERRMAKAVSAFYRSEGSSLTADQLESLIDQVALAIADIQGERRSDYQRFHDECHEYYGGAV